MIGRIELSRGSGRRLSVLVVRPDGRRRRSAARGMRAAGFPPAAIARALGFPRPLVDRLFTEPGLFPPAFAGRTAAAARAFDRRPERMTEARA